MEFDVISQMISQVGFPIFVAIFSLVKLDKNIRANTEALNMIAVKFDADAKRNKGA